MNIVPLQAVENQTLYITLGGTQWQLNIYQKNTGLFLDVYPAPAGSAPIIAGVLCQNLRLIVISAYLGFPGDLTFFDNQGTSDPFWTGLGARYSLIYLAPGDIPPNSLVSQEGET